MPNENNHDDLLRTHPELPGPAFERLAYIIARLRAPDGCPWDREQTHATLRTHLLEEACETMAAIEEGDDRHLREELGDLILQPVLHAQIASDENRFNIVEVLNGISDKLVRRHPHVFGEAVAEDSAQVLQNWDAIKQEEKAERGEVAASVLDDIPAALPALAMALKVSKKAAKSGFEWPDIEGVMAKLREEVDELEADLHDRDRTAEELGDLLFTAVNIARWKGINPELALRDTIRRFTKRFHAMEAGAAEARMPLAELAPEQWERLWERAKLDE